MRVIATGIGLFLVVMESPVAAQRLPEIVEPVHYKLTVTPALENAVASGDEEIDVRVRRATSHISLSAAEIAIESASVVKDGRRLAVTVRLDEKAETATLTTTESLSPGPARIAIKYTGVLNDQLRGFYLIDECRDSLSPGPVVRSAPKPRPRHRAS